MTQCQYIFAQLFAENPEISDCSVSEGGNRLVKEKNDAGKWQYTWEEVTCMEMLETYISFFKVVHQIWETR